MAAHVDISLSAFGRCLEHEHLVALRLWRWANRNARAAALECACAAARVGFVRAITLNTAPKASSFIHHHIKINFYFAQGRCGAVALSVSWTLY
jgi:hypothetical protein